ncbi:bifunctional Nucleotide-binding alpha-beta plait domain superfamily/RNA-binding domain superfamily/RNA recognition motif domain [Babesia duncani]|uniref:Bifunctional Nucleotide-binding alpha-beta plait domain superfamily/RNA-binding domain superfamily/RNA recognition motif domain n=1 Tax=Babesia duncani TaxID=323732 RepID=A0AAD9PN65_9APIC|nr:bifunctional Nucleotide-binding alpha-beta plait domain superfamily/RNA-binding domain superfamily/RNA recognition motif domain [Babesia duncani]
MGKELRVTIKGKGVDFVKKSQLKRLVLEGIDATYTRDEIKKALGRISALDYRSIDYKEDKWLMTFKTVSDATRASAILNGATLIIHHEKREFRVKIQCQYSSSNKVGAKSGRVFVRNLPFQFNSKDLQNLMQTIDEKATVHLPKGTRDATGFAFVQFSSFEIANRAIEQFSGTLFGKRRLGLAHAVPANLHQPKTKAGLKTDPKNPGEPEQEESEDPFDGTTDADTQSNESDQTANVENGSQKPPDDEQRRTLFVRNLNFSTTQEELLSCFSRHAAIVSCTICKSAEGQSKGTGFVLCKTIEDADAIMKLEELGRLRDEEFNSESQGRVRLSSVAGVGFSLGGRRLLISRALSREQASNLATDTKANKLLSKDKKRGIHLLHEGMLNLNSRQFHQLNPREQELIKATRIENETKLKNPNMFINPNRLCLKNLPSTATANKLRLEIASHLSRQFKITRTQASHKIVAIKMPSDDRRKVKIGNERIRKRRPFCFVDLQDHDTAKAALALLANNQSIYPNHTIIAGFAIEDSRMLYIQRKRKEQYQLKLASKTEESVTSTPTSGKKRKRRTYSRGKLQRLKRRQLKAAAAV